MRPQGRRGESPQQWRSGDSREPDS